jgi:hypothetical protein
MAIRFSPCEPCCFSTVGFTTQHANVSPSLHGYLVTIHDNAFPSGCKVAGFGTTSGYVDYTNAYQGCLYYVSGSGDNLYYKNCPQVESGLNVTMSLKVESGIYPQHAPFWDSGIRAARIQNLYFSDGTTTLNYNQNSGIALKTNSSLYRCATGISGATILSRQSPTGLQYNGLAVSPFLAAIANNYPKYGATPYLSLDYRGINHQIFIAGGIPVGIYCATGTSCNSGCSPGGIFGPSGLYPNSYPASGTYLFSPFDGPVMSVCNPIASYGSQFSGVSGAFSVYFASGISIEPLMNTMTHEECNLTDCNNDSLYSSVPGVGPANEALNGYGNYFQNHKDTVNSRFGKIGPIPYTSFPGSGCIQNRLCQVQVTHTTGICSGDSVFVSTDCRCAFSGMTTVQQQVYFQSSYQYPALGYIATQYVTAKVLGTCGGFAAPQNVVGYTSLYRFSATGNKHMLEELNDLHFALLSGVTGCVGSPMTVLGDDQTFTITQPIVTDSELCIP